MTGGAPLTHTPPHSLCVDTYVCAHLWPGLCAKSNPVHIDTHVPSPTLEAHTGNTLTPLLSSPCAKSMRCNNNKKSSPVLKVQAVMWVDQSTDFVYPDSTLFWMLRKEPGTCFSFRLDLVCCRVHRRPHYPPLSPSSSVEAQGLRLGLCSVRLLSGADMPSETRALFTCQGKQPLGQYHPTLGSRPNRDLDTGCFDSSLILE